MKADDWESFKVVTDRTDADRIAALLESSGVPAYVDHGALGMGLDGGYKIFVARHSVHRARMPSRARLARTGSARSRGRAG